MTTPSWDAAGHSGLMTVAWDQTACQRVSRRS